MKQPLPNYIQVNIFRYFDCLDTFILYTIKRNDIGVARSLCSDLSKAISSVQLSGIVDDDRLSVWGLT